MKFREIFNIAAAVLTIVIIVLALTLDKRETQTEPVIEETEYVQIQWMLVIDEPEQPEPLVIASKAEAEPEENAIVVRYVESVVKKSEEKTTVKSNSFSEYKDFMQQCCEDYGVPLALAMAVAEIESNFDADAVSVTGDYGLMQINEINHDWLTTIGLDPLTVEGNIEAGIYMLAELIDAYGSVEKALMAYNCGDKGAQELWACGIYETEYSCKVMEAYEKWSDILEDNA